MMDISIDRSNIWSSSSLLLQSLLHCAASLPTQLACACCEAATEGASTIVQWCGCSVALLLQQQGRNTGAGGPEPR